MTAVCVCLLVNVLLFLAVLNCIVKKIMMFKFLQTAPCAAVLIRQSWPLGQKPPKNAVFPGAASSSLECRGSLEDQNLRNNNMLWLEAAH